MDWGWGRGRGGGWRVGGGRVMEWNGWAGEGVGGGRLGAEGKAKWRGGVEWLGRGRKKRLR